MTELPSLAGKLFLEKMPFALVKACENMGRRIKLVMVRFEYVQLTSGPQQKRRWLGIS